MVQSLLKLLSGEMPKEVIWTADLEYWVAGQIQNGLLPEKYQGEIGRLKLSRDVGIMPYFWYDKFWLGKPLYNHNIEYNVLLEGNKTIYLWQTPLGKLEKIDIYSADSCSQACIQYPVSNKQQLEILLYLLKNRVLVPDNMNDYNVRRQLWAQYDGLPSISMPRSPLPSLAVEWCGIENLTYMLMDCEGLINDVLFLLDSQEMPILEAVSPVAPPLIHFADNLTSDFYTPFFQIYMKDSYEKRLDILHKSNIKCAVHLDGMVKGLLPMLSQVGFDAIEALTPAPVGDVSVEEMKKLRSNQNVILWGGMPGAMFCEPFTWSDIEKHLTDLFKCWSDIKFVLGVADQIPANGNIEICNKISNLVRELGYERKN